LLKFPSYFVKKLLNSLRFLKSAGGGISLLHSLCLVLLTQFVPNTLVHVHSLFCGGTVEVDAENRFFLRLSQNAIPARHMHAWGKKEMHITT
jgi:hypothetical protein